MTEDALARLKVCRREANFVAVGGGEDGRLVPEGLAVPLPLLTGGDPGVRRAFVFCSGAGLFFFAGVKDRKKDHSDSNCTESNSLDSGEYSRRAASRSPSILFSAKRIMKTVMT